MGLHHLSLGDLEPELKTFIYALIGVHVIVLTFWCCSACKPSRPHEKTQ